MSEKPKRPWLRFHLSTAIVMMIVVGGLLWANTRLTDRLDDPFGSFVECRGWPLTCHINTYEKGVNRFYTNWSGWHLLGNIYSAGMILLLIAAACEFRR